MTLQPLRDIIAVIPLKDGSKIGSLYVPETAKQRTDQGVILYRGPACEHLRVGDHVFFGSYVGTKVAIEPQGELIFMREVDVFFYDDGQRGELMIPHSLLNEMLEKAVGEAAQRGNETLDALNEVAEQLKAILDRRLANGLEF